MEFSHPCFQKDSPFLLEHIKRKIANPKQPAAVAAAAAAVLPQLDEKAPSIKPELVNKVMNDVKVMRTRQETLDTRFSAMKKENEALWREVAILRQKHAKQQQIVNKLIQFLVTLVQPTRGTGGMNNMSGVKRRFQLMIDDVPESAKTRKGNEDSGTVIRELTDDLFDQVDYDDFDDETASPHVLSPADEGPSEHDSVAESISSPNYQIEFESVVDHPQSDDDDHPMETIDMDDKIKYIIEEIAPKAKTEAPNASSPSQEWLENNVLSPQQIKQEELDMPLSISSVHESYGRDMQKTNPYKHSASNAKRTKTEQPQRTSLLNRKITKPALRLKINSNNINTRSASKAGSSSAVVAATPAQSRSATATTTSKPTGGKTMPAGGFSSSAYPVKLIESPSAGKRLPPLQKAHRTATKGYTNKNDFISTEMPSELFDLPASGSGSSASKSMSNASNQMVASSAATASPMLGERSSAGYNPTLSQDYAKMVFPASVASTSDTANGGKNMAVTMYNKGTTSKLTTAYVLWGVSIIGWF